MPRITNDIRNKKQRKTEAEAINGTNTKSNERVVPKQVDQKAAVVAESDEVVKKPRHGKRIAKAVAKKERNTQRKELFNKLAQHALSPEAFSQMRSSRFIGRRKETKRDALDLMISDEKLGMKRHKAGDAEASTGIVPTNIVETKQKIDESEEEDDEMDEESDDGANDDEVSDEGDDEGDDNEDDDDDGDEEEDDSEHESDDVQEGAIKPAITTFSKPAFSVAFPSFSVTSLPAQPTVIRGEDVVDKVMKRHSKRKAPGDAEGHALSDSSESEEEPQDTESIPKPQTIPKPEIPAEFRPPNMVVHETPDTPYVPGATYMDDLLLGQVDMSLVKNKEEITTKNSVVQVKREESIKQAREQLPIIAEEAHIMESINNNNVIIICGETGCGKTTQVPQFLYEAGFANNNKVICVTQPRRVAAVAAASRVAKELGLTFGKEVRYEHNVSPLTRILFVTDGVLLREMQTDVTLSRFSAVILDEAHERNVNTDILIGLLSRIIPYRARVSGGNALKLVIMSATLRVGDFIENKKLFPNAPPVINVASRQYPVTVHFSKRTNPDYFNEAMKKTCRIHRELPPGGILVFLSGRKEITEFCKRLRSKFPPKSKSVATDSAPVSHADEADGRFDESDDDDVVDTTRPDDYNDDEDDEESDHEEEPFILKTNMDFLHVWATGKAVDEAKPEILDKGTYGGPMYVLPLYAMLAMKDQQRVFQAPPPGHRLVVVATNVAESSLTIPNIRYVIDSGKAKEVVWSEGVSTMVVDWVSRANGDQRAGRAGRMGPGHCYRLYSSAVFQHSFAQFPEPEIRRNPIEDVALQMKRLGIVNVMTFPFPTPPDEHAMKCLIALGAVDKSTGKITDIGIEMSNLPVSPRFVRSKTQPDLVPFIAAIVAMLSVREPFMSAADDEEEDSDAKLMKKKQLIEMRNPLASTDSDLIRMLKAFGAFACASDQKALCEMFALRLDAMIEAHKLFNQLVDRVKKAKLVTKIDPAYATMAKPPSNRDEMLIQQIITAGFIDQIARYEPDDQQTDRSLIHAYTVTTRQGLRAVVHPDSCLHKTRSPFIIYTSLVTRPGNAKRTEALYMKGVSMTRPQWIASLGPTVITYSQPLENPAPFYDNKKDEVRCFCAPKYSPNSQVSWDLPPIECPFPASSGDLLIKYFAVFLLEGKVFPALKVVQPLVSKPSSIVRGWNQKRSEQIVTPLIRDRIFTAKSLRAKWSEYHDYLKDAVGVWVSSSKHGILDEIWPPVQDAAAVSKLKKKYAAADDDQDQDS